MRFLANILPAESAAVKEAQKRLEKSAKNVIGNGATRDRLERAFEKLQESLRADLDADRRR